MNDRQSEMHDLTRLVQHVALNESGWWQHAMERIVRACLYAFGPRPAASIRDSVISLCGMPPNSERVAATIDHLLNSGDLIDYRGTLRLSEASREALAHQESTTNDSEHRVRVQFDTMAHERNLGDRADELWSTMETGVVLPIVRQMGARMYSLMTESAADEDENLESQIADLLSPYGTPIRSFLTDFLNPHSQDIRGFVLRRLNVQYVVDAAALPHDALQRLSPLNQRTGRIDVFLDTNFVFSVLGLHDNPGDDVANELMNLIRELRGRVDLKLYVLPDTIDEARRVLREVIFRLGDFRGQSNLAEAATRTGSTGLTGRYFEEAQSSQSRLTPQEFFGPYESDLLTMLRSKSVELYNADLTQLRVTQEVIDDLLDQETFQARHRPRGAKPYDANLHDMVLWHFTKSKRSGSVESPLDIKAWVVTLDYGLISFDRHKRRSAPGPRRTFEPPICLEPSSLIQLFQFWVPSSTELDEALVGSVRQPLLFLNFDAESEKVTLRILSQLSRFEGSEILSPEVASEILTNTALRDRLSNTSGDRSADEEIVREEMVDIVQRLDCELVALRTEHAEDIGRIAQLEERVAASAPSTELDDERNARVRAERARAAEAKSRHAVESDHQRLLDTTSRMETSLAELKVTNQQLGTRIEKQEEFVRRARNWRAGTMASLSALLASGALLAGGIVFDQLTRPVLAWVGSSSASALILLVGLDLAIRGTRFDQSSWTKQLRRLRRSWWTFLLAIAASVIAGWILQS